MQPPIVESAGGAPNVSQPTPRRRCVCSWSTLCRGCIPEILCDRFERQFFFYNVMRSSVWRFFMCCCILLLLFGSHIQNLWCDKDYDKVFDVVYSIVFVMFLLDIILRSLVEPGYIGCNVGDLQRQYSRWRKGRRGYDDDSFTKFYVGSFLFWCDIVSTMSILYDISYINESQTTIMTKDITLDSFGIPTRGQINQSLFLANEMFLLVTIGKSVRVVRFVRSTRVANLLGTVNWYWPLQVLNPRNIIAYWCGGNNNNQQSGESDGTNGGGAGGGAGGNNGKNGKGANSKKDDHTKSSQADRSHTSAGSQDSNMRRRSWGGLGLATLTAAKAQKLAKAEQEKQSRGAWGKIKNTLWALGILRNDKAEWERQLAATKIQRAWRKARHHDGHERFDDYAWQGSSLRKSPSSAAAAFRKHSIMKHYQNYSSYNKNALRLSGKDRGSGGSIAGDASLTDASYFGKARGQESQVGGAMRELTGQRVAVGIILALMFTVIFTYMETDPTRESTMMVLHRQTQHVGFADAALKAARGTSIPDLYKYEFGDDRRVDALFEPLTGESTDLRHRETLKVTVIDSKGRTTVGWFAFRDEKRQQALGELLVTLFILLIWLFGVTAFAGPVMILVVLPIERMVRLLGMLMVDPLGYQGTSRYRKFVAEEEILTKNTRWTKEVLKGMETSFLMSTILRIGSLMKVGFGSAGVEIIRENLQKKQGGNVNLLTSKGSTVSCIFLFCDIRQFTDATECLQEEVFVFTNRIAAVVHSFCHSYGGSANKNIGDAFLCSWLLDDPSTGSPPPKDGLCANNNQADKCLLCVVKICMSLHHDQYYVETMSDEARERLLAKLSKRPGPVVQMGCGLHAGKAVQGAIGSERKIDATYVSEAVEMAEFLESSTKKYGVNMLMSDSFHRLLHPSNRYRCRIVDQIVIKDDDDDEDEIYDGDVIELYTYDINIDALWEVPAATNDATENVSETESFNDRLGSRREMKNNLSIRGKGGKGKHRAGRRRSLTRLSNKSAPDMATIMSDELKLEASGTFALGNPSTVQSNAQILAGTDKTDAQPFVKPELVLPTGPALYNANIWRSETMLKIRLKYSDGLFFHKFNSGLQSFYAQDWDHAKQCFQGILDDCLDDGPSKYFMSQIQKYGGKPPPNFKPYGIA